MDISNNGHDNDELTKSELQKLDEFIHSQGSTDKAFATQEQLNAIHMMLLPDGDMKNNTWRYDLPTMKMAFALAVLYAECDNHDFKKGKEFCDLLAGYMVSVKARRMNQFVDGLIGERRWRDGNQQGMIQKAKDWFNGK